MAPYPETVYSRDPFPGNAPFTRRDLLPIALLLAFCCYLFRDTLAGHKLIGVDFIEFYLPMKKFLYDEIHLHQTIPYWNPHIFGGMPYLAHFESTIFYPLGFLFYLIPPENAYGYTMFLHFVLAGLFMYLLARSLDISGFGSLVAASIFTCNGFVMAILFLGHLSPVQSYVWLPMVIYFLNRAARFSKPWGSAIIAGGIWGIQIMAGAPQDAFYTFLASVLFLICSVSTSHPTRKSFLKASFIALVLFSFGSGLSAVQILPAFELIKESIRASLDSYEMVTMGSYPLQGVITLLLPHFFGSYADGTMWVGNVPWSIPHQNLYTGILPIVLLGFVSLQWKEKKRTVLFGALLALLALVLAFGHHTPLYRFVYLLPGFDRFRAPSKIIVLWGFSIALMAGVGMDGLLRYLREKYTCRLSVLFFLVISFIVLDLVFLADSSRILRFFSPFLLPDAVPGKMVEAAGIVFSSFHRLTILSSFLLLFGLLMRRNLLPVSLGAASLCAFLLVDLAHVHSNAVRHDDAIYQTMNRIERSLADSLGRDRTPYRVGSFPHALGANFEMYLGYQTVNGFTALFPSRYYEYMNAYSENRLPLGWVDFFYGTTHNSVLMDLLNVKYEISHAAKSYGLRESFLPRAFLVPEYDVLEKSEVLHRLVHPDFDPKRTVLFEKEDHPSDLRPRGSSEPGPPGLARILSYRPDRMVVETDSPDFRYLFLSEMSYPGWNAFVDGQPTRILRGNYLFRVLEIPGGRHQVILEFDPWTIKAGTGITLLTVLLILGIPLFLRLRRKASLR